MKKYIAIILAVGLALAPGVVQAAEPMRLEVIKQRCTVIQTILDQTQRRDLVARTNRGRDYEATIRQLDALGQRLRHNNISTLTLDGPAANFTRAVDSFRVAYVRYDDSMNRLKSIDCRNKAAEFAAELDKTRVLRQAVGAEVARGEAALDSYRQALIALQRTLPAGEED